MDNIYIAEAIFQILREERQTVTDLITCGNVKSMEEYRELMGRIKSLELVEQELKILLEKQERFND